MCSNSVCTALTERVLKTGSECALTSMQICIMRLISENTVDYIVVLLLVRFSLEGQPKCCTGKNGV